MFGSINVKSILSAYKKKFTVVGVEIGRIGNGRVLAHSDFCDLF